SFAVTRVEQITPDEVAFKIQYKRAFDPKTDKIAGDYREGEIRLSKVADQWTVMHEYEHFLEDMGLINKMEQAILDAAAKKAGGYNMAPAENRAYYVQDQLAARDFDRKTPAGRILQKIADLVDSFVNLFTRTARGIVRDVESGAMMGRESLQADVANIMAPQYATTNTQTRQHLSMVQKAKKQIAAIAYRPETFGRVNFIHTQVDKALRSESFRRVFERISEMARTVSSSASSAAALAADILPSPDKGFRETLRDVVDKGRFTDVDLKSAASALSAGSLAGDNPSPFNGKTYSEDELLAGVEIHGKTYKLTPGQVEAYKQARAAVDKSVWDLATSEAWKAIRPFVDPNMWQVFADNSAGADIRMEAMLFDALEAAETAVGTTEQELFTVAGVRNAEQLEAHVKELVKYVRDMRKLSRKAAKAADSEDAAEKISAIEDKMDELETEYGMSLEDAVEDLKALRKAQSKHKEAVKKVGNIESTIHNVLEEDGIFDKARKLQSGGYMPLMRFGAYEIRVEDEDGKGVAMYRFDSSTEAKLAYDELVAEYGNQNGVKISKPIKVNTEAWKRFKDVSPDSILLFAKESDFGSDQALQEVYRKLYSERSSMKRLIRRKGVPGYSDDLQRILSSFITSNARRISTNYHAAPVERLITDIGNNDVQAEAQKVYDFFQSSGDAGGQFRSFAAHLRLLGSITTALINGTQVVTSTFPEMVKHGATVTGAASQLWKAYRDRFRKDPSRMTDDELWALARGAKDGTIDSAEIFHLYGMGTQRMIDKIPGGRRLKRSAAAILRARGMPFAWFEKLNRHVSLLASFRMFIDQGMNREDAYTMARQVVDVTQGRYGKENRPNIARSAAGGALLTFMQYKIMTLEQVVRNARGDKNAKKAAALQVLILMMLGGAGGAPFAEDIMDILDIVMQTLFDRAWLTKNKAKKAVAELTGDAASVFVKKESAEVFGRYAADFFEKGISGLPTMPLDVAGRYKMGGTIPGLDVLKPSVKYRESAVLDMFGVPGGMIDDAVRAIGFALDGEPMRGAKLWMPSDIQNFVKGVDIAATQKIKDGAGRTIVDGDMVDAALQMIGAQPRAKSRITTPMWEKKELLNLTQKTERSFVRRYAEAAVDGDKEALAKIAEDLIAWNRNNPDWPIKITGMQIRKAIMDMNLTTEQRNIRMAPKEVRKNFVPGAE
ncbi:MAG: PLxRFG domain-containing protein, partial [Clostridia bacterium]|nr:PLxRFG domain-containing protein [Clostridia bacterium]